jgi:hypothetical protein
MDSGKLAMNSYAERRLLPGQRAAIERDIPDGYRMTVQARAGAGDWSVRLYDAAGALCVVTYNHKTIKGGAYVALAKLAAAGVSADPPMTVTVDLEDNPTLVGWLMSDE